MISGERIRDARERAGLKQAELARAVGVSPRTIGNWERGETISRSASARLEAVLRDHLEVAGEPPLRSVSDVELLAEIARRFARHTRQESEPHVRTATTTQAAGSAAQVPPAGADTDRGGRDLSAHLADQADATLADPINDQASPDVERIKEDR